jgi:predicted TIM-barrel fold metal-dependent hydrolase
MRRKLHSLVRRWAEESSRKLGMDRRTFLQGPCGMAATLLAINALSGCRHYRVSREAALDEGAAQAALSGTEWIVDAQTHYIDTDPDAVWPVNNPFYAHMFAAMSASRDCRAQERFGCLSRQVYLREVFGKSDTQMAVLGGVPGLTGKNPLDNRQILRTRDLFTQLMGDPRILTHAVVHPNAGRGELESMHELAENFDVLGWMVYTPWGPDGSGWFLDDEPVAFPFLEKAQELGRRLIFCHKGLPWPNFDAQYCSPRDIGPAARTFPELRFIVYHSGYEADIVEGPYLPDRPETTAVGINRLVKSLQDSGIGPNQNVYAELGGTWNLLMPRPLEAAHTLGKLLKFVGEDCVLWGSDSLFMGPPGPQIQAFRAFEIPVALQEKFGYPALTPEIKAKVLGLNAAQLFGIRPNQSYPRLRDDEIERMKQASKSRRDLLKLWKPDSGKLG